MEMMLPQAPMLTPNARKITIRFFVIYPTEINGQDTIASTCVPIALISRS